MSSELFVSRLGGQFRAALRRGGSTVELWVERLAEPARAGRIIRGRVSRVVPSLQSAFVDVGAARDAFLHGTDLALPGERIEPGRLTASDSDEPTGSYPTLRAAAAARPPIQHRLRAGRELLVQVERESGGTKGDRLTCWIGLPGRLLVFFPRVPVRGVSRRIVEDKERERLVAVLNGLDGQEAGYVARTAARGASVDSLRADARRLQDQWHQIEQRAEVARAPAVVYQEPDLPLRLLRDVSTNDLERVVLDDPEDFERARDWLRPIDPSLASRITLWNEPRPMFRSLGLEREIEQALDPRVWLDSGAYLVIEQTEALVSIDVNTGKSIHGKDMEQVILETNMEATDEIARQLRLRDLGGIVVIDYIDMATEKNRERVTDRLAEALRDDPARTKILGLSALGLMQLTRKRTRTGVTRALTRACPTCDGRGRVKRAETLAAEILSELRRRLAEGADGNLLVRVAPDVVTAVRADLADRLQDGPGSEAGLRVEAAVELNPGRFEIRDV